MIRHHTQKSQTELPGFRDRDGNVYEVDVEIVKIDDEWEYQIGSKSL